MRISSKSLRLPLSFSLCVLFFFHLVSAGRAACAVYLIYTEIPVCRRSHCYTNCFRVSSDIIININEINLKNTSKQTHTCAHAYKLPKRRQQWRNGKTEPFWLFRWKKIDLRKKCSIRAAHAQTCITKCN